MKTVLITGASKGIGAELARICATKGHDLILVARSGDTLNTLSRELQKHDGIRIITIEKDLSLPNSGEELYNQIQQAGLPVEYLINNAGFGLYGNFIETSSQRELEMITLNITTLTMLCKRFLPDMVNRGHGTIVNLASIAAFLPGPKMAVYHATKAYVLSLSEALSAETQGTGVHVCTVCPGPTLSDFQAASKLDDTEVLDIRKLPTAAEVAEFTYQTMLNKKVVAIPGMNNKFNAFLTRLLPRATIRKVIKKIYK